MLHALAMVGSKLATVDLSFSSSPITSLSRATAKGKVESRAKTHNMHQMASVSEYGPKVGWCEGLGLVVSEKWSVDMLLSCSTSMGLHSAGGGCGRSGSTSRVANGVRGAQSRVGPCDDEVKLEPDTVCGLKMRALI